MYYYCICPVCMCALLSFVYVWCTGTLLLSCYSWSHAKLLLGSSTFEIPKTTTACWGYLWSWYTTVAGSVSFSDLLILLLGNWFWCTTAVRPTIHRGDTPLCRPNLAFGSATLLEPHTNLVRSRGAHPQGCSRAPFPVKVPSIGAAAAVLMGMVRADDRQVGSAELSFHWLSKWIWHHRVKCNQLMGLIMGTSWLPKRLILLDVSLFCQLIIRLLSRCFFTSTCKRA